MLYFLGFIHGADYLINHLLIGAIFFYFLILPAGGQVALKIGKNGQKQIVSFIGLSFLSSIVWMILSVHDMTESWQLENLWVGMSETSFAHFWCLKLALLLVLFTITVFFWNSIKNIYLMLVFALASPFAYVLTSHAAAQQDYTFFRMGLDWIHTVGVGIWSGGLLSLFHWLGQRVHTIEKVEPKMSFKVITRFSHFAMASTFIILLSGLVMAWLNGVSIIKPWESDYGILVLAKLIFFCVVLAAAAINQFLHLRNWNENEESGFVQKIRREVGIEIGFIVVIFILAGFLTRTSLPGG